MDLGAIAKRVGKFAADNSPTILTTFAVIGTVTTAYLAGKASYYAAQDIYHAGASRCDDEKPVDLREKVEITWKLYIPAASTLAFTVACIICANRISDRRAAALAAAYSVADKALAEYKDKVAEKFGDRKEEEVRAEIAQDNLDAKPASKELVIFGTGDVICFDKYSQRYFDSSVEQIKAAQNAINYQINHDFYASLDDFYDRIGLPHTGFSNEVGWNQNKQLEILITTGMTDDKRPCIVIDFNVEPIRGYFHIN